MASTGNSYIKSCVIREVVLRYFIPYGSRDTRSRALAVNNVRSKILNFHTLESPVSPEIKRAQSHHENGGLKSDDDGDAVDGPGQLTPDSSFQPNISDYLIVILRLSKRCPFEDVRKASVRLLHDLETSGVKTPRALVTCASAFIPSSEVMPPETDDEQTQMLFIEAFLQNNRLDHVTQVIGYHPQYLDVFLRTQHFLLRGDGPLPFDYRHYIALMAAGRHHCTYLINQQKEEFLSQGGDVRWLEGLENIPQKLRDIYEINKILAHRPWLLKQEHIEKLTKGKDNWSISEVVHAIVILTHYHSLASFVFGCGINAEIDHESGHTFRPASPPPLVDNNGLTTVSNNTGRISPQVMDSDVGVDALMQTMKTLSEQVQEETPYEELIKRFKKVESSSLEFSPSIDVESPLRGDVTRYIQDSQFVYQDFAKRGEVSDIPTFRVQDYSWDDHGYSLANRLYNDVGTLLDEKFKTAYNLTYYTMANRNNVDTTMFRQAIWNYIHCMFGIRHDDYDYSEVNQLLERNLKSFIKSVCCYPDKTTKKDYDNVMREFRHSEKVHVNLMILEARMQAELLYALRAIMHYMT